MADENGATSSTAQEVTAADVDLDFLQHEQATLAALRGDKPKTPEPQPKAEPAPAGETTTAAVAESPKVEPKPLTADDLKALENKFNERFEEVKPKEQPKEDPAPSLADSKYETFDAWLKDYNEWVGRQQVAAVAKALSEREAQAAEVKAQEEHIAKLKTNWETREADFAKRTPNYAEVKAAAQTFPRNDDALRFILQSEVGPEMYFHYASNRPEWEALIGQSEEDMRFELRLMEREFKRKGGQASSTVTAPAPKAASAAPPPPKVLGGRQTAPTDDAEAALGRDDFAAYEAHALEDMRRDKQGRFVSR